MAVEILQDSKLFIDSLDLSGNMNAIGVDYSAELQDNTVFGNDTRSRAGGLKMQTFQHEGYWDEPPDLALFNNIGLADVPMTVAPQTGADGEIAYTQLMIMGEYTPGGAIGEMFKFSVAGEAAGPLVRSTIMHNAIQVASGNGVGRQLGIVSGGPRMYAALHVLAASAADTLDVIIESDGANDFLSPSTRITFDQVTAIGSQWKIYGGPTIDDWWRVSFTIAGTSPSFQFVVVLGIQ